MARDESKAIICGALDHSGTDASEGPLWRRTTDHYPVPGKILHMVKSQDPVFWKLGPTQMQCACQATKPYQLNQREDRYGGESETLLAISGTQGMQDSRTEEWRAR